MSKQNPVAKFAHKFNKSVVMKDRKREQSRTAARKKVKRDEWVS